MTIYYQHIGERLGARDFPKSLGTKGDGLRRFKFEEVLPFLGHLAPLELADMRHKIEDLAPSGFQLWGIPSGAERVLAKMATGDFLMLLESTDFAYCGQVVHRVTELCHDLSVNVWGEQRFPIIILLQGQLISYGWDEFLTDFAFAPNYHMRGNTASIGPDRVASSAFKVEESFIAHLMTRMGTNPFDQKVDFHLFAEGLQQHLREVKEIERQHDFRNRVFARYGAECLFCGLDIPVALDAAHIAPKHLNGTDDARNGIPLCAVHHRLFDAEVLGLEPGTLRIVPRFGHSLDQLRVSRTTLSTLPLPPHGEAVGWRWESFIARQA